MWAYNRWLAEMCADAPDRIFGMAQTAVLDVDRPSPTSSGPRTWAWSA